MGTESDRRVGNATRIPFDAMVEVGGALGPSFEAKAINLSPDGMQLKTAYLPEVGQPVSCSFEAPELGMVLVSGVVIWQDKHGEGGEFGIRFTNIDPESAEHLKRLIAQATAGDAVRPGARVRLHIEGLASPMRGRVRDANGDGVTACSDLNFLQLGKPLDLEDAASGGRRPANIGSVELEIDPATQVPQLIVSMRYTDAAPSEDVAVATDDVSGNAAPKSGSPEPVQEPAQAAFRGADEELEEESNKMKSAWAKKAQNVGPALNAWAKSTKDKLTMMLKKRGEGKKDDVAIPLRRTTSPPPAGALHSSGRKVIRGDVEEESYMAEKKPFKFTKRHAAVAGAVGIASILAIVAFRKPAEKPMVSASTDAPAQGTNAENNPPQIPPPPGAVQPGSQVPGAPGALPIANNNDMNISPDDDKSMKGKKYKVAPFMNGAVSHGNVLRLRMDGVIEKIQGAPQPTGFTVVIPNRKSEEAAAPLAARDGRIAGINVANNPSGAELTISFKDGVPNYMVRAKGNYLEIVLAQGNAQAPSDKDGDSPKPTAKKSHPKHKKH